MGRSRYMPAAMALVDHMPVQYLPLKAACMLGLFHTGICLPTNKTDDQVNAAIEAGTFERPSALVRSRFRYWLPDASVNHTRVALDVADAGRVGAGGVEVLGYYLYGSYPGELIPVDWATYGWGTQAWKDVFITAAQAHKNNGLIMDSALGPNQGTGVPAETGSDGLQWDLVYNTTTINGSGFNGTVPGWDRGTLQAAVVGTIVSFAKVTGLAPSLLGAGSAALQDVTNQVGSKGALLLDVNGSAAGNLTLFTFYLVRSDEREQETPQLLGGPQTAPQNYRQNGSWIVDHFSALGAQTPINFWEQYLLDNETLALLSDVGNYVWEDSIEINPTVYWTRYLPQTFMANRGYSINKWLPLIFHEDTLSSGYPPITGPQTWYITDELDAGNKHIADYRETLGDLYGEYLSTFTTWAESLGLQYSAQNIPKVNAPECESLGFGHLIDGYRQYTGPANLAGKRIISSELGANIEDAYQQTLPSLLWDIKRSIAGGVNQFILHGYPYSGNYPNTTWPGFTTFAYLFSEMHGRHQPAWDFYSDSIDFIARNQYIFQSGVPKLDLAFYSKYTTYAAIQSFYAANDLVDAGYTYECISPDDFTLPEAYVFNGIFVPERQAFKAMVVRANDSMTVQGVAKLAEYAHAGLPVLFSGGLPTYLISYNASADAYVNETLQSLLLLTNVHVVPYDADYVFAYNDALTIDFNGEHSEGVVEFASTGTPYLYSAWTGAQTPITNYTRTENTTSIYFELARNQSIIVAFHDKTTVAYNPEHGGAHRSQLQHVSAGASLTLTDWRLVVEHWDPPADLYGVEVVAVKHNTTHHLPQLTSWLNISGLENVSGRGYYSTSFMAVLIDFGAIVHTVRVSVNGHTLAPLDLTWAKADISEYLVKGLNTVEAVVATPLYNRLKPIAGDLFSSGQGWSAMSGAPVTLPTTALQDYGLLNDVTVTKYTEV
ncbi:hypothetical protein LTR85_006083 [Meristemomyces frigidus]|nr:hypothetical protein LTR85_006083 [Meristemomyces frigidus]